MDTSPPPRPRWVKIAGLVVALVVLVLVVGKIAGVDHGPGIHGGSQPSTTQQSDSGAHTPPEWVPDHSVPGR